MPEPLTDRLFPSFQVAKVFKDHSRPVNSMDFDQSGKYLLTCSDDESMRIYTVTSGKLHNTVYSKKYGCSLAKFTHRSNNLIHASTKADDSIRYMSLHDNKYLRYFKGHTSKVVSLELSPIDDTFISASLDNTIKMWDLGSKSHHGVIETGGLPNPLVAFDPSGLVFALGLGNNTIKMYSFQNQGAGPFLSQFLQDPLLIGVNPPEWTKLTFSNDGKYLLISTRSNVIYLLDAYKATLIHRLTGHVNSGASLEASFTPDAKFVMSGSMDGRVYIWNVNTGSLLSDLIFHTDTPKLVKFSPKYLLMASSDSNLALWTPPPY